MVRHSIFTSSNNCLWSPARLCTPLRAKTAEDVIREDVLHLTYTAHDMEAFARDEGYEGPPFRWDDEDRLRRRARLDAVFFHLYGIDRDTADYILGTFPIVRREEEQRYGGRFRSRDLILGCIGRARRRRPRRGLNLPLA